MPGKNTFLRFLSAFVIVICGFIIWKTVPKSPLNPTILTSNQLSSTIDHSPCLQNNESADYSIDKNPNVSQQDNTFTITIKDKTTQSKIADFKIPGIDPDFHPIELHPCGVYVQRSFNQDTRGSFPPGYRRDLWKYQYDGGGVQLLTFFTVGPGSINIGDYAPESRIDSTERYIALTRENMLNHEWPNAIVIKDLRTFTDVYIVDVTEFPDRVELNSWQGNLLKADFQAPSAPGTHTGTTYNYLLINPDGKTYKLY